MKRLILNVACALSLATAVFSFYVITSPVTVHAASSSVTCRDGSTINCEASGGSCYSHDPDGDSAGYCSCTVGGQQTVFKGCKDVPLLD